MRGRDKRLKNRADTPRRDRVKKTRGRERKKKRERDREDNEGERWMESHEGKRQKAK
jgi:hypothetical protein